MSRPPSRLDWLAVLRSSAMTLAGHGWPVLRGTYRDGDGVWRGRADAVGLRPIDDDWSAGWTVRSAQVANWWNAEPYSVLVACGHGVDCIELPGPSGHRMVSRLAESGHRPPAMVTPVGTLVLFVRTPARPLPTLASVSLRSAGSWVAVPPTEQLAGPVEDGYRWVSGSAPGNAGWEVPELMAVYDVIASTARQQITATVPVIASQRPKHNGHGQPGRHPPIRGRFDSP